MRWPLVIGLLVVGVPVSAGWMQPGTIEIGVLTCTVGRTIDTQVSPQTAAASETREMICSFKPHRNGADEVYSAVVKSISTKGTLPEHLTILWMVKAPMGTRAKPGLLQQTFAADAGVPAGQAAPLTGERNDDISLMPMADKEEGSASRQKTTAPPYVVTSVELVLNVSVG